MKKLILLFAFISAVGFANAQWQRTTSPYGAYCFAIYNNNIFAGTDSIGWCTGVLLSTNNGNSWSLINTGLNPSYCDGPFAIKGDSIFAGSGNGIFFSTNNGVSWDSVNTGLTNRNVGALAINGNNIFAGTYEGGVFLSTNNGSSWNAVNTGLNSNACISSFAIKGDTIYTGATSPGLGSGGVYLSSNNGGLWTAVNNGLPYDTSISSFPNISALSISGNNIFAGTEYGMYLSSNAGSSWVAVNSGINWEGYGITALAISGNNIYAGCNGVYLSSNNGSSWINIGLIGDTVTALTVYRDTLFAGTFGGIWRLPLVGVGIKEINNNASNVTVYPNPATDKINVISNQCSVSGVEICNILWEKIYNLPITDKRSPITINCSSFASGVYFIKATTEKGVVVRKFIKE
jgi:hypothetical protein